MHLKAHNFKGIPLDPYRPFGPSSFQAVAIPLVPGQQHCILCSCIYLFHIDVAEVAFNRCVTTNEGKKDRRRNKVHATSDTFVVDYNYEFLEDFWSKHSPDR